MKVTTELAKPRTLLRDIPNGTFFNGRIDEYVSQGPFLKVGSASTRTWVVVKLESMQGCVWVSGRNDQAAIDGYEPLQVDEVVLRSVPGSKAAA